jgi:hypothetical protein
VNPFTRRSTLCALSSLSILAGCSGGEPSSTDGGEPTYVRDIQPLLNTKCAGCHTEGGIAPFALETYEQVNAMKGAVKTAVVARIMPPWLADDACADYVGNRSLTGEQVDAIVRWVDGGAPLGNPSDTPVQVEDTRLTLSRVDLELPIPAPYTPKTFPDDYRCFFLDWPATATTYVTGFGVAPGNQAIVHHVIAYVVRPDKVSIFQALEDADPEQGWTCFGGPGGDGPGQASWIGGWVPGLEGEDNPEGTGIEVPAGSKIIVQMHYNSQSAAPAPDQTKILLRTDAAVAKKAAIMPLVDTKWITAGTMTIPAHSKDVVHSALVDPTTFVELATAGAISGGKPLTVYSAGLHMHTLAKRGVTRVERAGGSSECLLDIPRWDFNWQGNYTFATPKQVFPGDQIHLECQWDNPGDTDVGWGEGTSDEMCLGLYYLTE